MSIKIIYKNINKLIPYENNPRFNDDAVDYVANSIKEFGFKVPVVIDKNNVIVAGHTRLKAAMRLGIEDIPCIVADDLTDEQVKAFRLADNKVGEMAIWDYDALEQELDGVADEMNKYGFNGLEEFAELDRFFEATDASDVKKRVIKCPCCGKEFEL